MSPLLSVMFVFHPFTLTLLFAFSCTFEHAYCAPASSITQHASEPISSHTLQRSATRMLVQRRSAQLTPPVPSGSASATSASDHVTAGNGRRSMRRTRLGRRIRLLQKLLRKLTVKDVRRLVVSRGLINGDVTAGAEQTNRNLIQRLVELNRKYPRRGGAGAVGGKLSRRTGAKIRVRAASEGASVREPGGDSDVSGNQVQDSGTPLTALVKVEPPSVECPKAEDGHSLFACPSLTSRGKYRCIDENWLCDGRIHCPKGEDENPTACMFHRVTRKYFKMVMSKLW